MSDSFIKYIDLGLRILVWTKFKDILGITDMNMDSVLNPKTIALRTMAEKRANDQMEFISMWRNAPAFDWSRQRSTLARTGLYPYLKTGEQVQVKAVPVTIDYEVRFWTHDLEKLNKIQELYAFWQHENPNLDIMFNNVWMLELDLHFSAPTDESTTDFTFDRGNYFVVNCPIKVDAWIFQVEEIYPITSIVVKYYDNLIDQNGVLLDTETIKGVLIKDSITAVDTVTVT